MIHHVFANRSNVGDWMSARGIQALLNRPVVEHLCDTPFVPATLRALRRLGPRDLIVIGGGGLFHGYFTPFWEGFAALAARVPFVLWGVGSCDLKVRRSPASRDLVRDIAAKARLVCVRDTVTCELLAPLDVAPPIPCPSLSILAPPREAGFGLLHVASTSTSGRDAYRAMRRLGRRYATETGRVYRETNNRIEPDDARAMAGQLDLYGRSDLILSSRLHGCIFAVGLGRLVLAVSGDFKIDSFLAMAGLSDWILDRREMERLPAALERLPKAPLATEFAASARAAQRRVAERVLAIADDVAAGHDMPRGSAKSHQGVG